MTLLTREKRSSNRLINFLCVVVNFNVEIYHGKTGRYGIALYMVNHMNHRLHGEIHLELGPQWLMLVDRKSDFLYMVPPFLAYYGIIEKMFNQLSSGSSP